MIRYALTCGADHGFEAWFRNSQAFDHQLESGALSCPLCGNAVIRKAPMAPGLVRSTDGRQLADLRRRIEQEFEDVGAAFAEEVRQMHYGEVEPRPIRGEASLEEAKTLLDEGIAVLPLPPIPDYDA